MTELESNELWNSYFYPNTTVLRNKLNLIDDEKVKEAEATYSFERLCNLQEEPLILDGGKQLLNEIHRTIFQDVYEWAGKYRMVNIQKQRGSFLHIETSEDIDHYLDRLFNDARESMQHCGSKLDFCNILAKLYTGLIYCHPYREGNGRAIREFIREYTIINSKERNLGSLELDWSKVDRNELNKFIDVSHYFPGQTALLLLDALTPYDLKTK